MVADKRLLSKLKDFGLNSYEIKVWAALLSRGVSSAGELSDISNVPRSRTYDVLEGLEKKGFIMMKLGKPIKYIAVPPEEVIDRVKRDIHERAKTHIELIDDIKNDTILEELNMLYKHGIEFIEPTELSGAVRSRENMYQTLNQMIKGAEKSVCIMTTAAGLIRKSEALRRSLEKASRRGVSVRIAAPVTKDAEQAAKSLQDIAEVRHVAGINARFVIVDGKQIVFNLLDDKQASAGYDAGIWVNTEFFSGALEHLFEHVWQEKAVVQKPL